jgi:DnaK suppressor protein
MKSPRPKPRKLPSPKPLPPAPARAPGPVPARWAWHRRALLGLREVLLAKARELRAAGAGPLNPDVPDAGDTAESRAGRGLIEAELRTEEGLLEEVEAALGRIAAGSYGICEATGRRIPPIRLRAIPWTRFTREAAVGKEQQR